LSDPDPANSTGDDAPRRESDGGGVPHLDARTLVRQAQERLNEVVAAYKSLRDENDGYRDRVRKNSERRFAQRHERLLLKFIDILDNLDRALEAAELSYAAAPMIEGLILVRTQLLQTLQEEGLERIPVLGLAYDPEVAEAMATHPVDDPDQHHVVVKDLQRGYRLNGRVARASQVVVGEYDFSNQPAPEAPAAPAETEAEAPGQTAPQPADAPAPRDEPSRGDSGRVAVVDDAADTDALVAAAEAAAAAIAAGLPAPEFEADALDATPGEEDRLGVETDEEQSLEDAARAAAAELLENADEKEDDEEDDES
jgi:molecular chaperone GrpE